MRSKRFSRPFAERPAGFSLVELLVTMGIMGVVMTGVVKFFTHQASEMREHSFRIETQQALRGALDAITRDVRLAGACLPTNGNFMAVTGTDDPNGDSITVRTGLVRPDLSCVFGRTTANASAGTSTFVLDPADDVSDFEVDKMAYIRDPNGSGELRRVSGVNGGANSVSLAGGVGQVYPAGSTIYAVDQRRYALDKSIDPPVLTLTIDEEDPQAFAAGITNLDFEYILDENCPSCTTVNLSTPLSTADWWLVNEIVATATAESVGGVVTGDEATLTQTARAKPRNLLP